MKRLVLAMVLLVVAAAAWADDGNQTRSARERDGAASVGSRVTKSFPTVAKNQKRPIQGEAGGEPWVNDWPDPEGGGGGVTECVKKHECSGGAICATGSCNANELKSGCKYCTGYKCKNVTCN